ncbi:hypothetical protein [Phaeobacter gallaeciensis]|uniref:hypothetical protein n=1 Tax=Phaeobacter gallaeciensis TaxID=60890 RepID=UPI000BBCCB77|nr:hypothetical protein [Phaeobacter gallaeciensis]ATF19468.1 hypothetical protein PhaeoP129_02858 [Phaeobacter gallaeciensis]ATF23577.1 hypothetical protein PhaeoP128_02859 [Phaeobacter gallaeciensis]
MAISKIKSDAAHHSFDPKIAMQVGTNAAVVFRNLVFWVRHNEANRRNFHEGRYWTYNSLTAFTEQFPYLSAKQIRTALDKLLQAGLVVKGNFAEDRFNRANWYALGEANCPKLQMHEPERANDTVAPEGDTSALEGESLIDRCKPDKKPYPLRSRVEEVADDDVDAVWHAFPQDRRRNRPACERLIVQALQSVSLDDLIAATRAYSTESAGFSREKVSFIDNWFRQGRWQRHLHDLKQQRADTEARKIQESKKVVNWIRTKDSMCEHLKDKHVFAAVEHGLMSRDEAQAAGFLR